MVVVAVAVLLANLPYLLGFFDANPLGVRSGLLSSATPGLLAADPTIDPNIGYSSQAIGHLAALDLLHLRLPWWNPYEVTGMPLLGETQAAALFVPTLLTAFSGGQLFEHILLELIAGLSTYLLLRRLNIGRIAAVAGGVAFALNGTFAWFAHAAVNPVPFLPMLLIGIERAFEAAAAGRPGGWRLIALAGALSLYAGFPEVAYIDALMALCWIGWRCGCLDRGHARRFLAKAALGAAAAALLAAPVLVAMTGYLGHADIGAHASARLGNQRLHPSALPQLLMPYVYGPINGQPSPGIWKMLGGYLSTSLLLFAALGLFARGRRGLRLVLLGWGLLVFARMYGLPGLDRAVGILPDVSKIEFFRYGTPALELSVVVLAALGLDDLARFPEHRNRLFMAAIAVLAVAAVAALGAWPLVGAWGSKFGHNAFFAASVGWGALVPALAAGLARVRAARVRAGLLAALVAVDALALFATPEFSAPRAEKVDLAPVAYLQRHLGDSRFFSLGPIAPNYGSYFGLASLNINDFPPKSYATYVNTRLDPFVKPMLIVGNLGGRRRGTPSPQEELMRHLAGYRAAGVRYVVAPAGQALPQSRATFALVFRSRTTWVYRLAGASSYFSAASCDVSSRGRASVHVVCPHPATLVRRETWFPGWSARRDGHPVAIRRQDGLFQAVTVPAGIHDVKFSFEPPGIEYAFMAVLVACALMLAPPLSNRRVAARATDRRRSPASSQRS